MRATRMPPNPRLQRTPPASPSSPLNRKLLGGTIHRRLIAGPHLGGLVPTPPSPLLLGFGGAMPAHELPQGQDY